MTPLLPFSVWKTNQYGIVVVLSSSVMGKQWEIYIRNMDSGDVMMLECDPLEWIQNSEFVCETSDLQIYDEEDEE
jgi:hypothetical protein